MHPVHTPSAHAHVAMRVKPNARRMEVEVPLDTSSVNYSRDDVDDGTRGYKQIETLTLRSSQVISAAGYLCWAVYAKAKLSPPNLKEFEAKPRAAAIFSYLQLFSAILFRYSLGMYYR